MKEIPTDFVVAPRTLKQVILEFLNFHLYLRRKENSPGYDYQNYYQSERAVLVRCQMQKSCPLNWTPFTPTVLLYSLRKFNRRQMYCQPVGAYHHWILARIHGRLRAED